MGEVKEKKFEVAAINISYKTLSIVQNGDKDQNLFIYVSNFITYNGDKISTILLVDEKQRYRAF
ncbi:hypothetical protein [Wolbachia endosymbiont of Oedothorax gibbosus]|uniref:hypothetical protein n=1 Tax=Wolbachia endosymbiont of Oedothorax gibbosus TaxID=931100 RepID=UPI00202486D2|nr:hypothetical protein [Wolbachia endosymbiont of Oedothorax gibbosus]